MTREETIQYLNKLYTRAELTDVYGDMEDMTPYEEAVDMAIQALEQEPFMNKPCVSHKVCHEDKVKVLNKIIVEMQAHRDKTYSIDPYDLIGDCIDIVKKYSEEEK